MKVEAKMSVYVLVVLSICSFSAQSMGTPRAFPRCLNVMEKCAMDCTQGDYDMP